MEIILVQDVPRLGKAGEKISVKDGYARNYLIPKGLVLPATTSNRRQADAQAVAKLRTFETIRAKADVLGKQLEGVTCTIPVAVGAQGKLHGAVTAGDIQENLQAQGIALNKQQIALEKPIAQVGLVEVPVKLHPEVTVSLKVSVVADS